MKKITISRKRWARGGKNGVSRLLNGSGNMCCLGFLCRQVGYRAKEIRGIGAPSGVVRNTGVQRVPELVNTGTWTAWQDNFTCGQLMRVNDRRDISDREREKQLKALAKEAGYQFVFKP